MRQENEELRHRLRNHSGRATTPTKRLEQLSLENEKLRGKVETLNSRLRDCTASLKEVKAQLLQSETNLKHLRSGRGDPYQPMSAAKRDERQYRSRTPTDRQQSGYHSSRSAGTSSAMKKGQQSERFHSSTYDSDSRRRTSTSRGASSSGRYASADQVSSSRRLSTPTRSTSRRESPVPASSYGGRFDPTAYQAAKDRQRQRSNSPMHPKAFGAPTGGRSGTTSSGYASDSSKVKTCTLLSELT